MIVRSSERTMPMLGLCEVVHNLLLELVVISLKAIL